MAGSDYLAELAADPQVALLTARLCSIRLRTCGRRGKILPRFPDGGCLVRRTRLSFVQLEPSGYLFRTYPT